MNAKRRLVVWAFCALVLTYAPVSQAAVLYCFASISSGPHSAAVEEAARTSALAGWVAEARKLHGDRFTAWRLSQQRVVHCAPASGGGKTCEVCGRPWREIRPKGCSDTGAAPALVTPSFTVIM